MVVQKGHFLNLLATSAEKLKNGTFAEKDAIARIWFLNLRIGDKKEVSYLCKTEIKDLVKFGNVISGGPEGTLLEPAPIVAKLLVERNYGRIFRLPAIRTADAPELNDEYEYIL